MAQANGNLTLIPGSAKPENPPNPLDTAVHTSARKLLALRMMRLAGEPEKRDAQNFCRDILDFAAIVDEAWIEIGREARSFFGNRVDLTQFTDVNRCTIEGNATHTVCAAMEAMLEDRGEARADSVRDFYRRGAFLQAAE